MFPKKPRPPFPTNGTQSSPPPSQDVANTTRYFFSTFPNGGPPGGSPGGKELGFGKKRMDPPTDADFVLWYTVTIISIIIFISIIIALIVYYFKKTCKMPQQKSGKLFIALFVITLIFWMTEAALTLTTVTLAANENIQHLDDWLGVLPKIFYNIARGTMLFYFIIKSYVVFKDSNYAVSKLFVIILCILTIIAFILQVFPLFYGTIDGKRLPNAIYFICGGWVIDFIVSLAAMWKFVHILFTLTLNNTDYNDNKYKDKIRLSNVQLKMMKTITRTTVLSIFALMSSAIIGFFFNPYPRIAEGSFTGNDLNISALSDSALNAICMYLSYGFATTEYGACCKYCNVGIEKLCIWCTKKAIQRKSGKEVVKDSKSDKYDDDARTDAMDDEVTHTLAVPSKSSKTHEALDSKSGINDDTMQHLEMVPEVSNRSDTNSKDGMRPSITAAEQ